MKKRVLSVTRRMRVWAAPPQGGIGRGYRSWAGACAAVSAGGIPYDYTQFHSGAQFAAGRRASNSLREALQRFTHAQRAITRKPLSGIAI